MRRIQTASSVVAITLSLALSVCASAAIAAPFAISHVGTQSPSSNAAITSGQTYSLTLVVDNGSATANSQTWGSGTIRCVIWRFNNARNIVFTQDVAVNSIETEFGSITTNASGTLQSNFSQLNEFGAYAGGFTLTGASFTPDSWYANDSNSIFITNTGNLSDGAGGVQMAAGGWTNPVPFSGDCAGRTLGAPPPPASVPTMSEWAMILLGIAMAGVAAIMIQKRSAV